MNSGETLARSVDRGLWWIEQVLIALFAFAALFLGTMQVVLRYVFNTGFEWNEAVFILCTVTGMLVAGSRAVRENVHVRVDVLHMVAPPAIARWLDLLAYLSALALCAFYVWCGYLFVAFAKMMDTASPDTGIKDWIVYSIMPLALLMFCIRYVLKIREALAGGGRGSDEQDGVAQADTGDWR